MIINKLRQDRKRPDFSAVKMTVFLILLFFSGNKSFYQESIVLASDINPENVKHVLYINSYHPGYRWSDQVQAGIVEVLAGKFGKNLDLRIEYLDAKRYPAQLRGEMGDAIAAQWKKKYSDVSLAVIIVSDQDGYNLLGRFRNALFPGVPLVFCGVEEPGVIGRNSTGVLAGTDYRNNIELILKVMPDAKRIWVITDQSATGRANRSNFEYIINDFKDKVSFSFFDKGTGLEPEEIFSVSESLGKRDAIFFMDFYNSRSGEYVDIGNFLQELCDRSTVAVFSHVDMYLDYGVTGGLMNSGYIQGRQAAEIAARIIDGVKAYDILPAQERTIPAFNYSKLTRYGIPVSAIPYGSRIINREESFVLKNLRYFAGGTVLIIVEGILIAWLFRLLKRQRKLATEAIEKEKLISRSEAALKDVIYKYDLIVEASGQVVYEYIVSTGEVTWGISINTILGYQPEEISGGFDQWIELLHPDDRSGIMKSLADAETSCSFWDERYRMLHKEGHYVWIRDRGFFIPDESGRAYYQVGMLEDITSLKASEDAMDFERRQLLSIFDSIDQIIYVSDPVTYEILFANKRLRDQLRIDPIGKLCYKELQGFEEPCSFCTNRIILENKGIPYKWEYYNQQMGHTVDIVDRIIRWPDGVM